MSNSKCNDNETQGKSEPECKKDTFLEEEWDEHDEHIFTLVYFSGCDLKPPNN